MQGLNTTPVHGHAALFGVYGMLGLGLMLFCLRALRPGMAWKNGPLWLAFWSITVGLAAVVLFGMLPIGLMQAWASVEYGTWYARSTEFLQTGIMGRLRWLRMIGDTIFAFGAIVLGWFILGLLTGHSYDQRGYVADGEWEIRTRHEVPSHAGD
jgi:nitric oxide reductase subunit B